MREIWIGAFLGSSMTAWCVWLALYRGDQWWHHVPMMLVLSGGSSIMWIVKEHRRK